MEETATMSGATTATVEATLRETARSQETTRGEMEEIDPGREIDEEADTRGIDTAEADPQETDAEGQDLDLLRGGETLDRIQATGTEAEETTAEIETETMTEDLAGEILETIEIAQEIVHQCNHVHLCVLLTADCPDLHPFQEADRPGIDSETILPGADR